MEGIQYRLREFIDPADHRSIVVDTSAGLSLGALPGLEDFAGAVRPVLSLVDGVVCSPGQLRRLGERTRAEAALLVRMEWTNTLRGPDFVLPPSGTRRVPVLTPQDALDLGAVAMVTSFLLGYEEEIEADCLRQTAQWAIQGKACRLPLVVEVCATGPRIALPDKAIELGASYALEAGADVIVVPYPGLASLDTLAQFVSVPWLFKPSRLDRANEELGQALSHGAAGVWLDHGVFAQANPASTLKSLAAQVHPAEAAP
jgi:DhnA family fructose-bisphosphate aldolase class Ia